MGDRWFFPAGLIRFPRMRAEAGRCTISLSAEKQSARKTGHRGQAKPAQPVWPRGVGSVLRIAVLALAASLVVELGRPPVQLPPAADAADKGMEVVQAMAQAKASRGADMVELTETQVNDYLAQRAQPRGFLGDLCQFEAVRLQFLPGICRVWTIYNVLGWKLYLTGLYRPTEDCGRPVFSNAGGAIGRLPLAPWMMRVIQPGLFGQIWDGLIPERQTINRFRTVEFEQQKVIFWPLP